MGIDQEVGYDTIGSERHVLLIDESPDHALLPVTAGELVPQLWDLVGPEGDSHKSPRVEGLGDEHIVDPAFLAVSHQHRRLPPLLGL